MPELCNVLVHVRIRFAFVRIHQPEGDAFKLFLQPLHLRRISIRDWAFRAHENERNRSRIRFKWPHELPVDAGKFDCGDTSRIASCCNKEQRCAGKANYRFFRHCLHCCAKALFIQDSPVPGLRFLLHSPPPFSHASLVESLSPDEIERAVKLALAEDIGAGDATTLSTVPESARASASVVAREAMRVAGLDLSVAAFRALGPVDCKRAIEDAHDAAAGQVLLRVQGPARCILSGERVALNFLQRLCGIATLTARFVEAVAGTPAQVLDTRKTTPGWRALEKYAVRCGGGRNHRFGLFDMVLIKDNHVAALRNEKPNPIAAAVNRARAAYPRLKVEVEADTLEQVQQAADAGADIILLDNMTPAQLRAAVEMVRGRAKTEASGGISLTSARVIADTGVDFLSVGALTHSAPAMDIGLDFDT